MFCYIFPVIVKENIAFESLPRSEKTNDIFDLKFISLFGCFLSASFHIDKCYVSQTLFDYCHLWYFFWDEIKLLKCALLF